MACLPSRQTTAREVRAQQLKIIILGLNICWHSKWPHLIESFWCLLLVWCRACSKFLAIMNFFLVRKDLFLYKVDLLEENSFWPTQGLRRIISFKDLPKIAKICCFALESCERSEEPVGFFLGS